MEASRTKPVHKKVKLHYHNFIFSKKNKKKQIIIIIIILVTSISQFVWAFLDILRDSQQYSAMLRPCSDILMDIKACDKRT